MTFVEELKQLSEKVELQHKLDRQLAEIRTRMKTSARNGYRGFQIEILIINTQADIIYLPDNKAENYYSIYTADGNFYYSRVYEFLSELGFDLSELTCAHRIREGYSSMLFSVVW